MTHVTHVTHVTHEMNCRYSLKIFASYAGPTIFPNCSYTIKVPGPCIYFRTVDALEKEMGRDASTRQL